MRVALKGRFDEAHLARLRAIGAIVDGDCDVLLGHWGCPRLDDVAHKLSHVHVGFRDAGEDFWRDALGTPLPEFPGRVAFIEFSDNFEEDAAALRRCLS